MTLFSMMCSSCLPLLNLRRKGLKPNTSVKSMNHPLFISFNWKKEGEKKTVLHRWDVWSLLFFFLLRPDEKKKESTKVSLFIHPPLSLSLSLSLSLPLSLSLCGFGRTGLEEKPDPERAEIRAGHPTPRRGPTVLGNAPLLSLRLSPLSTTLSLSLSFPLSLPLSLFLSAALPHLPSSPSSPPLQHLLGLTPDTAPPLRFHPFPA